MAVPVSEKVEQKLPNLELGAHHETNVYNVGPLKVDLFTVSSDKLSAHEHHHLSGVNEKCPELKLRQDPPRPLFIAAPTTAGQYPVVLFQHGFSMRNTYYSQLLSHVASHGFILVAPQMYLLVDGPEASGEIAAAASVVDWFSSGLRDALSQRVLAVEPDLDRIAVMGHSRGGKVVFGLVTGVCNVSLRISAVVGLDPMDGTGVGQQTTPPILKYSPHSLNLKIPTLITGAGLGSNGLDPRGISHQNFFSDSAAPAVYFVAPEYGHMDYSDDDCPGLQGWVMSVLGWICSQLPLAGLFQEWSRKRSHAQILCRNCGGILAGLSYAGFESAVKGILQPFLGPGEVGDS
ncbi:hypothetical protein R1flu_006871 [Riccia fluitans]|uniref:Chlorophyllase n=1 Tax=Riccia fluitans TaxID=41844 RepID=A0ABD1Z1C4_9MARC